VLNSNDITALYGIIKQAGVHPVKGLYYYYKRFAFGYNPAHIIIVDTVYNGPFNDFVIPDRDYFIRFADLGEFTNEDINVLKHLSVETLQLHNMLSKGLST